MEGGKTRSEAHDEGVVKIELKQLPLYVSYVIVFLQFVNPTLVTDLVHILYEYSVCNYDSRGICVHTGTPILSRPLQYPQE